MTPAEIIKALKNSPEALDLIVNSLLTDDRLEHYWGLELINGKIVIHYEYFGFSYHVPMKYIDKGLIPLHSHIGLNLPHELLIYVEKHLSDVLGDELDVEKRRITGTTYPSHNDIISFVLHGHAIFGVCSKYSNYVKISFYDTDSFEENDFRCILETLIEEDDKINRLIYDDVKSIESMFGVIRNHIKMWSEKDCLGLLDQEPYASHLIIPL